MRGWLGMLVRLILGGVWVWAGWANTKSPRGFVQTVRTYDATPQWLSAAIGYGLPVLEVALGLLLIAGVAVRAAAATSAVLLLVFLVGLIEASARGIKLDCGCFGGGGPTAGATHYTLDIGRTLVLLVLAVLLALWPGTRLSVEEFLARHDHVAPPSAKRLRSDQGQRKYLTMLEARRREARVRTRFVNGSLALVVTLIVIIGIGVQAGRAKIVGSVTAANASASQGVVYGKKAAAMVDVYEDFQCPGCRQFEQAVHTTLEADVVANLAQVRYHPLALLDRNSRGNRYSSRAANAALCASDVSVNAFVKYHDVLFGTGAKGVQVQPAVGSNGRSDTNLVTYAQQAGLTSAQVTTFESCVQTEQHQALVQAITEDASKSGVTAIPTVRVNGVTLAHNDLATLQAAIAAADRKGPAPAPSPAPSPSVRPSGSAVVRPSVTPKASVSPTR